MNDLRIALVQICPETGNAGKNAEKIIGYMEKAAKESAGLVLFPECSLTGYAPEKAEEICISNGSAPVAAIEKKAGDLGIAVCFGYAESTGEDAKPFITQELYFEGKQTIYRKTCVAPREEPFFLPGNSYETADVRGVTAAMQICWESHMPKISSIYRSKGAQLLLFPYASGMSGDKCIENWSIHLPARASDNGCFAAACNLLSNGKGGGSAVWDPKGKLIARYSGFDEEMTVCDIGGELPREKYERGEETMHTLSYFDHSKEI